MSADPLGVECPYCTARPAEECWETQGAGDYYTEVFVVEPHAARVREAERREKEGRK